MSGEIAFVVMAAGIGSRYNGSKQLQTFGKDNLTIAEYNMQHALKVGFRRFYFVVSDKLADLFHERLKNLLPPDCTFGLVYQKSEKDLEKFCHREKPWGTAHAVMCCEMAVECNFCVTNADDLYGYDGIARIADFLISTEKTSPAFGNVAYELSKTLSGNGTVSRGIITTDANSYLRSIDEVRELRAETLDGVKISENSLVSMNLWGFTPKIFKLLRSEWSDFQKNIHSVETDEFQLPAVINSSVKRGACSVKVLKTKSEWVGITYRADNELLEKSLAQ
jgi:NDP-sugar pyrophosphorylase family protein